MGIQAVLFDLDDTLLWDERSVKEAFEATCRAAAERYAAIDPAELEQAVRREARALYESFETFPFTKMIGINPFKACGPASAKGSTRLFASWRRSRPSTAPHRGPAA